MEESKRKFVGVIVLLLIAAVLNVGYRNLGNGEPSEVNLNLLDDFPEKVGEWYKTEDIVLPQATMDILDPDAILYREYKTRSGDTATLVIEYHIRDRWGAHQPEVCYTSQGWDVLSDSSKQTKRTSLENKGMKVNQFTIQKGKAKEIVLYWWFSSGRKQTASRTSQMLYSLKVRLLRDRSGNGFIRVSVPISEGNETLALSKAKSFAEEIVSVLPQFIP